MDTGDWVDPCWFRQLIEDGRAGQGDCTSRIHEVSDWLAIYLDVQVWGAGWRSGMKGTASQPGLVESLGRGPARPSRHGLIPGCLIGGEAFQMSPLPV